MFVGMLMSNEFYMDVELRRGLTPVQVEVAPPENWEMPACPQFVVTYFNEEQVCTVTLQLENGTWYDRDTRLAENQFFRVGMESRPGKAFNPDYESPLEENELLNIGQLISNYMTVQLTAYLNLFVPVYRTPTLN